MDLIGFLQDDHEIIRKFIREIELEDSIAIKKKIFSEMLVFLRAHFRAEEIAVYARSLRMSHYELNELALDLFEEHHMIEDMVYKIRNVTSDRELWMSRITDFCQILDIHLDGEEADFFPELLDSFSATELEKAAVVYLKSKKAELTQAEQELSQNLYSIRDKTIN